MMSQIWTQLSRLTRHGNHAVPNLRGAPGPRLRRLPAQMASKPLLDWFQPGPFAFASAAPNSPLFSQLNRFYCTLCVLFFLAILVAAPATQAESLPQTGSATLQITGPAQVTVGETFEIQVILNQPQPPGVFGYQFRLNWDSAAVTPSVGSPNLSPDFPLLAQSQISNGQLLVAASRQGDVPDLTGSLTLLTWTFEAVAGGTSPTPFDLTAVTLGQKDGAPLPIAAITPLTVQVVEPSQPQGTLTGNIQLEGPAAANLTGTVLLIEGLGPTAITSATGDFAFTDLDFGVYTLTVRRPGFLSATCTGLNHNSETTSLSPVTLLAGDITGDGAIDVTDATALGRVIGENGGGVAADLNQDGAVNVLDLILLAINYGQSTAAHPWICQ